MRNLITEKGSRKTENMKGKEENIYPSTMPLKNRLASVPTSLLDVATLCWQARIIFEEEKRQKGRHPKL